MEALSGNLYDYPKYYDLVFGSDWQAEYHFLLDCFDEFLPQPPLTIFEPACGTGRLMYRLAKLGFQISGLDLNPAAIKYCNQRLQKHGFPETGLVGDMTDFVLPQSVEIAFNMINSFRHLTTADAANAHFNCMGKAVEPGGLYVLGLHLTPTRTAATEEEEWTASRGSLTVSTHMKTISRDSRRREERFLMKYKVQTPSGNRIIQDEIVFRTYTAAQFAKMIEGTEFEIEAAFDFAYDIENPIQIDGTTEDVVYILRRK
jgi:SAM-dependent methyltransferase